MGLRDWSRPLPQLGIVPVSTAPALPEHYWKMGEVIPPDEGITGGMDGTGSNVTVVAGVLGQALDFNGNNSNVNSGDVVALNAVAVFTIAFWMKQDAIDQTDWLFRKGTAGAENLQIVTSTNGQMYISPRGNTDRGHFDYSTAISAGVWHHIAMVFSGGQTGNANKLKLYVDGVSVVLTFDASTPATTADLTGQDFLIGYTSSAFNGTIDDFRIYSSALTVGRVIELVNYRQ